MTTPKSAGMGVRTAPIAGTDLVATRAYTFPASVVSVLLGAALTFRGMGESAISAI